MLMTTAQNSNNRMFEPADGGLTAWIRDDITWCIHSECPATNCHRNPVNMMNKQGLHSYADFKGTSECLSSTDLDKCINGCIHARELFAKHDDPDDAMRELTDLYCDDCMLSSVEED